MKEKIKIQIVSEMSYQIFPITDENACIEVFESDLQGIGTTKKFDLKTKQIVSRQSEYDKEQQKQQNERLISELKNKLTANDYKIRKCMEYQLLGLPLPYDITEIHSEDKERRIEINRLESETKLIQLNAIDESAS